MVINKSKREAKTFYAAAGSQVEYACKALLRLIWSKGLTAGARLPTHWELCETIGVSTNSLTPAMRRLVAAGVIARKPKVGTVVVDPDAFRELLWRVGIAENFENLRIASPYFSVLGACVQNELVCAGCWPRPYLRRAATERHSDVLADYPQLAADVAAGLADGAICLGNLSRGSWARAAGHAPLCGFSDIAACGARIDLRAMVREAVPCLTTAGCRRIEVIWKEGHPAECDLRAGFQEGLAVAGLPQRPLGTSFSCAAHSEAQPGTLTHLDAGGQEAQRLLGQTARRRPDGLIVTDDYIAAGLTAVLRARGDYRPSIAVITHFQTPQIFALPVLRFELDIAELARRGVAILVERLRNPGLPDRVDAVAPQLVSRRASAFPRVE